MGAVPRALLPRDVAAALQRQAVQRMLSELRTESVLRPDFAVLVAGNDSPAAYGILIARYVGKHYPHVMH